MKIFKPIFVLQILCFFLSVIVFSSSYEKCLYVLSNAFSTRLNVGDKIRLSTFPKSDFSLDVIFYGQENDYIVVKHPEGRHLIHFPLKDLKIYTEGGVQVNPLLENSQVNVTSYEEARNRPMGTCLATSAFGCLSVLHKRGLIKDPEIAKEIEETPERLFNSIVSLSYDNLPSRLHVWDTLKEIFFLGSLHRTFTKKTNTLLGNQKLQSELVTKYLEERGFSVRAAQSEEDLKSHLSEGYVAIHIGFVRNYLRQDVLPDLDVFNPNPKLRSTFVPKTKLSKTEEASPHASLITHYVEETDSFVVLTDQEGVINLWSSENVFGKTNLPRAVFMVKPESH